MQECHWTSTHRPPSVREWALVCDCCLSAAALWETHKVSLQLLPACKYFWRFLSHIASRSSLGYDGDFWFSAWPPCCPWGRCVLISIDLEQENTEQIGTGPRLSQIQELTWNTAQNTFTVSILQNEMLPYLLYKWGILSTFQMSQFYVLKSRHQDFRVGGVVSYTPYITQGHSADLGSLTWTFLTIFLL